MLLNNKQIQSSIILDENTKLFEIKLPGIKRQFESIYYSYKGSNKKYGKLVNKFNGIFGTKLVGITRFNNYYIICFIDLKNLESEYFFVKTYDVFKINLEGKKNIVFIYKDFTNKLKYFCDYKGNEYSFKIDDEKFIVKNTIFGSEIFSHIIYLDNILTDSSIEIIKEEKREFLDIADFFIYDDFFIKSNTKNYTNFYKFIEIINNKTLKIDNSLSYKINITEYDDLYYPKIKLNLSVLFKNIDGFKLKDFRKMLLSFFSENISCYLINSKNIQKHFNNYFHNFTNVKIEDLKLDFDIPKNIYNSDRLFEKFKLDLLKLRYNLFLLKESYKLNNKQSKKNNEHIKLVNKKLNLNKYSLEKTIISYENIFKKLLEKIKS